MKNWETYGGRILQRLIDFRLLEKHIPTTSTPQHAFKRRQPISINDAS